MKKARVMELCCLGQVIKRLLKEMRIDLNTASAATGIPYTTLYDWTNGVVPSNPDQVYRLKKFFKKSLDYLYYGNDQDQEEHRRRIKELEEKNLKLEFENADQRMQLSIFEEIRKKEKATILNGDEK